jgi:hypothetical protein
MLLKKHKVQSVMHEFRRYAMFTRMLTSLVFPVAVAKIVVFGL